MTFEPAGDISRRAAVVHLLSECAYQETVTYARLAEELGLDPAKDRVLVQNAVHEAIPTLECEFQRTVANVRGVGYRVIEPEEHLDEAKRHRRKAGKSVRRAVSKLANVNLAAVAPGKRAVFDAHRNQTVALSERLAADEREMARKSRLEDRILRGGVSANAGESAQTS